MAKFFSAFVALQICESPLCFICFAHLQSLLLHLRHCPKVMNFVGLLHKTFFSLRGINADNYKWARWARLACSGSQSEPSIHFILPMSTASYIIKYIYFPMPLSWAPFSWTWQRYSWNFWDTTQNSKHKYFYHLCGDTLKCFKHQTGMLVSMCHISKKNNNSRN